MLYYTARAPRAPAAFMAVYQISILALLVSFCLDEEKFKKGEHCAPGSRARAKQQQQQRLPIPQRLRIRSAPPYSSISKMFSGTAS